MTADTAAAGPTAHQPAAGAPARAQGGWHAIDWPAAHHHVRRLHARLVQATQEGRGGKGKALQHLLPHSFSGKAIAVKRVTDHQGKHPPGGDRDSWNTPAKKMEAVLDLRQRGYRPRPRRRGLMPKSHGTMRPLGIPTMRDRAMQALSLLALAPIAETTADPHSYGCSKERSTAAAMRQCYSILLSGATSRRAPRVPPAPQKGMRDRAACRPAPRGGHAAPCPPCGFERYAYHASRNRHCPTCQTFTTVQGGEDRKAAVLPVPSCHVVCMVPHDRKPLILAPTRPLLTLLCNAASQTLVPCGPRNLGGQIGCTMVLHTWDQPLGAHCHVHGVMAAGALASTGERWSETDPRCLCPVRALSTVLRGKCCAALAQAGSTGAWPLTQGPATLRTPEDFAPLRAQLYAKAWVVSAKAPCAGPAHV